MTVDDICEIHEALAKLGYDVNGKAGIELYTVAFARIEVFIGHHERVGLYDLQKHTFVD